MENSKKHFRQSVIMLLIVSLILTMTPLTPSVFAESNDGQDKVNVKVTVEGDETVAVSDFSDESVSDDIEISDTDEFDCAAGSSFNVTSVSDKPMAVETNEGEAKKLSDQSYKITVSTDTEIRVRFDGRKHNETASDASEDGDTDDDPDRDIANEDTGNNDAELTEPEADTDVADIAFNGSYVSNHFNKDYVSSVDLEAFENPVTYARSNAAYTRKGGDKLMEGKDQINVIAAMNYYTLIYDVDPESDYFVALPDVNMGIERFSPYVVDVIYNNNANEKLDDVYFDEATSILYINKKYYTDPDPEGELFDDTATTAIQVSYKMPEE